MNIPDLNQSDDPFAALLAAYDESLAGGGLPPPVEGLPASRDLMPRLVRAQSCLQLLEEMWPRSGAGARAPAKAVSSEVLALRPPQIGRYRIRRELERSEAGMAFLASDPVLHRKVVLRVPRPESFNTPERRWRFLREVQTLSGLEHPNLIPALEAGVAGPLCYLATEYCEAPTLADWMRRQNGPAPHRTTAALMAALAGAVHHAHGRGVLHRCLSPDGVLLQPKTPDMPNRRFYPEDELEFVPRLADLGLARLFKRGQAGKEAGRVVSPYTAPEQVAGPPQGVGPHTDIYALGAILFELLTGQPPFGGRADPDLRKRLVLEEPVRPRLRRQEVPRDLETIALKCLEKEPPHRYPSALAVADDLRSFLNAKPLWARPPGLIRRLWRRYRRRRALARITW